MRGKRGTSAASRVEKLLSSPLFHLLHGAGEDGSNGVLASRVRAINGDLSAPGLGLSDSDAQLLCERVNVVIHCAANVQLDAHVQNSFR